MFPNKIKLTDDYIDLIVKKRKEHGLTAYQLSEKIGKNKSWLPNVENHRTKNISKDDLLLIFNDFAQKENLDTEAYIIKYLHPNAMVELENGHSIICSALQTRYELLSLEGNTSDYLDNSHFYLNELPRQNDIKSMKLALADLNEVILNEFSDLSQKERAETLETINTMRLNLKAHFELTQSLYKTDIFKYEFTNWFDKNNVEFIEEVSSLIEDFSINISLLNAKRKVFSFFSDSHDFYTLSYRIANYGYLDFDELSYILEDIEAYVFSVYDYIELAYKIANKTNSPASIDYHKIYSIMRNFFSGFISIAKLPYNFEFDLPKNSVKENEIKEIHLKATHILFQIKQTFQNKYHLK